MTANNALIRSFIAIELPAEVTTKLEQIQNILKSPRYDFVKWVPASNIHITLKFLGNIRPTKIDDVVAVMDRISRTYSPFELEIGDIGAFPNLNNPRVLWIGVDGDIDKLRALQTSLEDGLAGVGFAKELRAFTPHLTLARLREHISPADRREFRELIMTKSPRVSHRFLVTALSLMRSQLQSSGAVYTRIAETKLGQ